MDQLIDQVLHNRYWIQSLLGRKTGRRTFLASDLQTHSAVVIKLLLFGPDFTWDDLKLFEREAETLKALSHPSIPRYLDSFEVETELGKGFALVQSYIEARSLQNWIQAGRNFSEEDLKTIAKELLGILDYLRVGQRFVRNCITAGLKVLYSNTCSDRIFEGRLCSRVGRTPSMFRLALYSPFLSPFGIDSATKFSLASL